MQKIRIAVCLLTAWAGGAHAVPFAGNDIDALAMGGAGVASATSNTSLSNPALLVARQRSPRDFMLLGSVHSLLEDPDNLDNALKQFKGVARTSASQALTALNALEGKTLMQESHGSGTVLLASADGSASLLINSYTFSGARVNVAAADRTALGSAIPTSYQSTLQVRGASFIEAGVSFGRHANIPSYRIGEVSFGITPKIVVGKVSSEDKIVDTASIPTTISEGKTVARLNLDLGAAKEFGRLWTIGVAIKNLIPREYGEGDHRLTLGPNIRAGVAQHNRWGNLALDLDLLPNGPVGYLGRSQMIALGADLGTSDSLRFRLGASHDLNNSRTDRLTAGIGVNIYAIKADLIAIKTTKGQGFGAQLGLAF